LRTGILNKNSSQYHSYIGIQLNPAKNRYKDGNAGTNFVANLKAFAADLNTPVRRAVGLDPYDITVDEIIAYQEQSKEMEKAIAATFNCNTRELKSQELGFVAEYVFTMSTDKGKMHQQLFGEEVTGKDTDGTPVKAIRPNKRSFYQLQTAGVVPKDKDTTNETLKLRQAVDGEQKEQLVQFLIVSKMPTENQRPGSEWLYNLQKAVQFPVGVSIRAHLKSNEKTRKELDVAGLHYKDQRKQANQSKEDDLDEATAISEAGAKGMKARLQK